MRKRKTTCVVLKGREEVANGGLFGCVLTLIKQKQWLREKKSWDEKRRKREVSVCVSVHSLSSLFIFGYIMIICLIIWDLFIIDKKMIKMKRVEHELIKSSK